MQAIVFRYSLPRFALATVLGALTPRAYTGPLAPTSLLDVPEPTLPAARFQRAYWSGSP